MDEWDPVGEFAAQLCALRRAAGNPTLGMLIHQAGRQDPPVTLVASSLSAWFNGKAVPQASRRVGFLLEYLRGLAAGRGHKLPAVADYERLRRVAWAHTHADRGGRPSGPPTLEAINVTRNAGRENREPRRRQKVLADWLRSQITTSAQWSPPGIDPRRGISQQDIEEHLQLPQPVEVRARPSSQIRSGEYSDAISVLRSAVEHGERALLAGGPGTGKTFLLRNLYRQLAVRAVEDPDAPVPLLLRLADLALSDDRVSEVLGFVSGNDPFSAVRALLPLGTVADVVVPELRRREVVLLADALDEMPGLGHRDAVERRSRLLTLNLPMVITCRGGYFDEMLGQSELDRSLGIRVTLRPAVPPEVLDWFVPRWCELTASPHRDTILETLTDDPSMRGIADRPLLVHMTVDVAEQLVADASTAAGQRPQAVKPYPWRPPERQWLRLDIFRRYTRRWLEVETAKTRLDERRSIDIRWQDKDQAMRLVARAQFFKDAVRTDNEKEHGTGLTEQAISTALKSDPVLLTTFADPLVQRSLTDDVCRRTFIIRTFRNPSSPRYRFTHKQFLEYYIAHDLLERLSDPDTDASYVIESLSRPLQEGSVYFLREGLGDFAACNGDDRRAASTNLWRILNDEVKIAPGASRPWVRQHAANLLPQVATPDVLPRLVSLGYEEPDLFVRRGLAVGLAMHGGVAGPVDAFVRLLDSNDPDVQSIARSAALGYSRSYHGDRPFTGDGYDDDSPEASGTTKALVERVVQEVEFVVPIRALTLAELRCLIIEPARRARPWLLRNPDQVQALLRKIFTFTSADDPPQAQARLLIGALFEIEELRTLLPDV